MLRHYREADLTAKHQGFVYQVEAFEAVKELPYAAVFHEQGLGKTKIGVDLVLYWLRNDIVDSVIIITKKGLIQNWRDELAVHTHLEPRLLSQDKRSNFYAFNSPSRIYLAHYEVVTWRPCWTRPTRSRIPIRPSRKYFRARAQIQAKANHDGNPGRQPAL